MKMRSAEYDDLYLLWRSFLQAERSDHQRFFEGKTLCEIAEEEGQSFQAISKSTACT